MLRRIKNTSLTVLLANSVNYVAPAVSKVWGTLALMNAQWSFTPINLSCQIVTKYFPIKVAKSQPQTATRQQLTRCFNDFTVIPHCNFKGKPGVSEYTSKSRRKMDLKTVRNIWKILIFKKKILQKIWKKILQKIWKFCKIPFFSSSDYTDASLANGFGTPNTKDRKKNVPFFTAYFLTCLFYLAILRNHRCYLPERFHINVKYFLSHYFSSRTPGLESWWHWSHTFIWNNILGGWNKIILKIQDHATVPSFSFPYPILHYSHYFPLLCTMPFFSLQKICDLFSREAQKICLLSASGRVQRELICRSCCWPCTSK